MVPVPYKKVSFYEIPIIINFSCDNENYIVSVASESPAPILVETVEDENEVPRYEPDYEFQAGEWMVPVPYEEVPSTITNGDDAFDDDSSFGSIDSACHYDVDIEFLLSGFSSSVDCFSSDDDDASFSSWPTVDDWPESEGSFDDGISADTDDTPVVEAPSPAQVPTRRKKKKQSAQPVRRSQRLIEKTQKSVAPSSLGSVFVNGRRRSSRHLAK